MVFPLTALQFIMTFTRTGKRLHFEKETNFDPFFYSIKNPTGAEQNGEGVSKGDPSVTLAFAE